MTFSKDNWDECPLKRVQQGQTKPYVPGMWYDVNHMVHEASCTWYAPPDLPTSTNNNVHCDCSCN